MDFGFTNDDKRYEDAIKWKCDALKDGWVIEPIYKTESVEFAAKLSKEGFVCNILTKFSGPRWKYEVDINIWGPDELAVKPPYKYNWDEIIKGLNTCNYCGASEVKTKRIGFAGRCCENCLPELRKKFEYPGWCN